MIIPPQTDSEIFLHVLVLTNLGKFYDLIELHDNAELHYNKAINVLLERQEGNSELMAVVLCNLGRTYFMQGKESEAEKLWNKAYEVQKNTGREYSSITLQIFNYLSACVSDDKVFDYIKKSNKVRKKIFPPDSPEHSETFMAMADMFLNQKKHSRAIAYYKRALHFQKNENPIDHKKIFYTLYLLALGHVQTGNHKAAHQYFINAQKEETLCINQMLFILNDKDRLKFLEETYKYLYLYLTFVKLFMIKNSKAVASAYNIYLSRKGLLLETQKEFHEALINNAPPEVQSINKKLNKIRSRLAAAYHTSNLKIRQKRKKFAELERKKGILENDLRRYYEPSGLESKVVHTSVEEIINYLPSDSALVEFAEIIDVYDYEKEIPGNSHYYAFVVSKSRSCKLILEDLGEAENINANINDLRKLVEVGDHKSSVKDESKSIKELSRKLHDSIFLPIKEHIGKKKQLFICPDGDLNLIPFEILVDPEDNYLIEKYTFNYLTSGRDLLEADLKKKQNEQNQRGKIVLIGNPDYGFTFRKSKPKESNIRNYNIHLSPLPNTEQEIIKISELFNNDETLVYTGKDASEENLRSIKSPKMLHLATHGFFLPSNKEDNKTKRSEGRNIDEKKKEIIAGLEDPLLCSGIALAGFNMATNSNGLNDGVVTAEEVLNLNLLGTELVTLSACETGLGKVGLGEGVFGLRSAFSCAGAAAMVMSLWKVPDQETKDLMINFYTNIVKEGMNKNQALRKAALDVMKEMKKKHGHTHPRFWGGFIFSGASN